MLFGAGALGAPSLLLAKSSSELLRSPGMADSPGDGRLSARPTTPVSRLSAGLQPLRLADGERDGLLFIPASYRAETAVPLMLLLHGAGQRANLLMDQMQGFAEEIGAVLLSPDSRGSTWDVVRGGYGPDIAFIDRALKYVFNHVRIDPARVSVAGFSDGASYALSIGRINGDLFRKIGAFSPGFIAEGVPFGKPRIYVSHGTNDQILPFENARDNVVPALKKAGYSVEFHQFEGRHRTPPDLRTATKWLAEP